MQCKQCNDVSILAQKYAPIFKKIADNSERVTPESYIKLIPWVAVYDVPFSVFYVSICSDRCNILLNIPYNKREKARNASLIIQMNGATTEITDPSAPNDPPRKFTFDYSYWSHDGFEKNAEGYLQPTVPHYADQVDQFDSSESPPYTKCDNRESTFSEKKCFFDIYSVISYFSVLYTLLHRFPDKD